MDDGGSGGDIVANYSNFHFSCGGVVVVVVMVFVSVVVVDIIII